MIKPDYSTTRSLVTEKPVYFGTCVDGLTTKLKTPDSKNKTVEGGLRLKGFFKITSEENPLITVVTVVYNGADFLKDTIESVINQTYNNVEYIIIDGGSTDSSLDIIKKYEGVIDYWVSESDKGIYDAMNKGITLGTGDWINFMNSGDYFSSIDTLNNIDFKLYSNFSLIYGDKLYNGIVVKALPVKNILMGVIHACHQSMFFNFNFLRRNHLFYNKAYKIYADYDLVARLYKSSYMMHYVEMPVAVFQGDGVSSAVSWQKRYDKYHSVLKNFGIFFLVKSILKRIRHAGY